MIQNRSWFRDVVSLFNPSFSKLFFLLLFLMFFIPIKGSAETSVTTLKIQNRLRVLEEQLTTLEKSQEETIAAQNEIVDQVKFLKIWVNKRR